MIICRTDLTSTPPGLAKGFVMVHEDCCRAHYRPSRVPKGTPLYICLNKSTCRSLAGGKHQVLRSGQRAVPGAYEGIFSSSGKLLAAKSDSRSTTEAVEQVISAVRASDRAQVEAIQGLTAEELSEGGLSCQISVSQAEDLVSAELDQEAGDDNSGVLADKNAMLLGLLSSLVKKIERLDEGMAKRDQEHTTTLQ